MHLADQIPGLREAIEREQFNWDAAFLRLPEIVCGVELRPMTMLDLIRLKAIKSPYICGGGYTIEDAIAFFKLQALKRGVFADWSLVFRVSLAGVVAASIGINDYLNDAFSDSQGSKRDDGPVYYSGAAAVADMLGDQYGWDTDESLSLPLKILFQLDKRIADRKSPGAVMFNPSDTVRGEWLAEQNKN